MNVSRVSQAMTRSFINVGRRRARQVLLAQSDRLLADNGFSRELLKQGINAWPWQIETSVCRSDVVTSVDSVQIDQQERDLQFDVAMVELNRYSDAELFDLGISRPGIADAVRQGRIGVERYEERDIGDRAAA